MLVSGSLLGELAYQCTDYSDVSEDDASCLLRNAGLRMVLILLVYFPIASRFNAGMEEGAKA